LCKPQIIMLPLVMLLWDYWPLKRVALFGEERMANGEKRHWRRLLVEKFPLFFICLMDASVTLIAQHVSGAAQPWPLWARLENAVVSYTRYIRKAFWPTDLALYYPHPGGTLHFWQWGTAVVVLLAITAAVWRARDRGYLIVGWLWFLIMLVPMIGLVQADVQGMADRYAYLSFIGLFVMICWGVADIAAERHVPSAVLPAASVAAILALTLVTHHQIGYWQDDITLWSHSAQVTTGNWKAELFWGSALDADGQHDAAVQHYLEASKVEKHDPFIELSIAHYEQGHRNFPMAVEYYQRAVGDSWNSEQRASTLRELSSVYRQMGDYAKADESLGKINTLPQRQVNWQGSWWEQILPTIEKWLHGGKS
jgi:tetratricopeptide (TPR) repeat protein